MGVGSNGRHVDIVERSGTVYFTTNIAQAYSDANSQGNLPFTVGQDAIVFVDLVSENTTMKLYGADKLTAPGIRDAILSCMLIYDADFDTPWDRELDELKVEWGGHAFFFWGDQSACDIDFDNDEANKPYSYFINKGLSRGKDKIIREVRRFFGD